MSRGAVCIPPPWDHAGSPGGSNKNGYEQDRLAGLMAREERMRLDPQKRVNVFADCHLIDENASRGRDGCNARRRP